MHAYARVRNAPSNREFQYSDLLEKTDNFHSRRGCQAHVTICVHRFNRLEFGVSVSHRLQIRCHKSCGGPAAALSTREIPVPTIRVPYSTLWRTDSEATTRGRGRPAGSSCRRFHLLLPTDRVNVSLSATSTTPFCSSLKLQH